VNGALGAYTHPLSGKYVIFGTRFLSDLYVRRAGMLVAKDAIKKSGHCFETVKSGFHYTS